MESSEFNESSQKESIPSQRKLEPHILTEIALSDFSLDEVISSYKEFEELIQKYQKMVKTHAEKNRHFLKLNPDEQRVHQLLVGLAKNKLEFGKHFCPCMVKRICGDPAEDRKRICPCYWHKQDIELDGECECGMFVKI